MEKVDAGTEDENAKQPTQSSFVADVTNDAMERAKALRYMAKNDEPDYDSQSRRGGRSWRDQQLYNPDGMYRTKNRRRVGDLGDGIMLAYDDDGGSMGGGTSFGGSSGAFSTAYYVGDSTLGQPTAAPSMDSLYDGPRQGQGGYLNWGKALHDEKPETTHVAPRLPPTFKPKQQPRRPSATGYTDPKALASPPGREFRMSDVLNDAAARASGQPAERSLPSGTPTGSGGSGSSGKWVKSGSASPAGPSPTSGYSAGVGAGSSSWQKQRDGNQKQAKGRRVGELLDEFDADTATDTSSGPQGIARGRRRRSISREDQLADASPRRTLSPQHSSFEDVRGQPNGGARDGSSGSGESRQQNSSVALASNSQHAPGRISHLGKRHPLVAAQSAGPPHIEGDSMYSDSSERWRKSGARLAQSPHGTAKYVSSEHTPRDFATGAPVAAGLIDYSDHVEKGSISQQSEKSGSTKSSFTRLSRGNDGKGGKRAIGTNWLSDPNPRAKPVLERPRPSGSLARSADRDFSIDSGPSRLSGSSSHSEDSKTQAPKPASDSRYAAAKQELLVVASSRSNSKKNGGTSSNSKDRTSPIPDDALNLLSTGARDVTQGTPPRDRKAGLRVNTYSESPMDLTRAASNASRGASGAEVASNTAGGTSVSESMHSTGSHPSSRKVKRKSDGAQVRSLRAGTPFSKRSRHYSFTSAASSRRKGRSGRIAKHPGRSASSHVGSDSLDLDGSTSLGAVPTPMAGDGDADFGPMVIGSATSHATSTEEHWRKRSGSGHVQADPEFGRAAGESGQEWKGAVNSMILQRKPSTGMPPGMAILDDELPEDGIVPDLGGVKRFVVGAGDPSSSPPLGTLQPSGVSSSPDWVDSPLMDRLRGVTAGTGESTQETSGALRIGFGSSQAPPEPILNQAHDSSAFPGPAAARASGYGGRTTEDRLSGHITGRTGSNSSGTHVSTGDAGEGGTSAVVQSGVQAVSPATRHTKRPGHMQNASEHLPYPLDSLPEKDETKSSTDSAKNGSESLKASRTQNSIESDGGSSRAGVLHPSTQLADIAEDRSVNGDRHGANGTGMRAPSPSDVLERGSSSSGAPAHQIKTTTAMTSFGDAALRHAPHVAVEYGTTATGSANGSSGRTNTDDTGLSGSQRAHDGRMTGSSREIEVARHASPEVPKREPLASSMDPAASGQNSFSTASTNAASQPALVPHRAPRVELQDADPDASARVVTDGSGSGETRGGGTSGTEGGSSSSSGGYVRDATYGGVESHESSNTEDESGLSRRRGSSVVYPTALDAPGRHAEQMKHVLKLQQGVRTDGSYGGKTPEEEEDDDGNRSKARGRQDATRSSRANDSGKGTGPKDDRPPGAGHMHADAKVHVKDAASIIDDSADQPRVGGPSGDQGPAGSNGAAVRRGGGCCVVS